MHLYKQLLVIIIAEDNSLTQEDFQHIYEEIHKYSQTYVVIFPYMFLQTSESLATEEPADYIVIFKKENNKITRELKPYENKTTQKSTEEI